MTGSGSVAVDRDVPALREWFLAGAHELVEVLDGCPAEWPVWGWLPGTTAGFWRRRQAHETAVHRWDAQAAIGDARSIEPALAADGIDEWLSVFAAGRSRALSRVAGGGESFHLHCVDTDGEWTVRFEGPGVDVRAEHGPADVAVRGSASDILLFVWGRRSSASLEVVGDAGLLDRWSEFLPAV